MIQIISVTPENVKEHGLFCIKSRKNPGYLHKLEWFLREYPKGLRLKILQTEAGRQIGFIEYTPAEQAWRPVEAPGYLFIHCMYVYKTEDRDQGFASRLIQDCLDDAQRQGKAGLAVICSDNPWLARKDVFVKNGFELVEEQDGFELLQYALKPAPPPKLRHWRDKQPHYQGWQLLFAGQCPWHQKCAEELAAAAWDAGIELELEEIDSPAMAQNGPSGFGTFALAKDGELLEYHYISKTRFRNILKKLKR